MLFRRLIFIMTLIFLFVACSHKRENESPILMQYGDKVLTLQDVEEKIPEGLTPADSASLFKAIVDGWLKETVLSDFAEEQLYDTEAIDRKVREYRNNLIVQEYLSRMQETRTPKIDESKMKEYYELHNNEMKLEVPLVKGVFMKINNETGDKEALKRLMISDNPDDIDIIDKEWLDRSVEYNYFRDKWIDWETISGKIPYRFGDADKFLKENNFFETEYGDCAYYLQISDYILSGDIQPYEYARTWIANVLTLGALADYERVLVNSLIEKAVKENKLKMRPEEETTN